MPEALRRHELVRAAWEGIDPGKLWDSHCHLTGTGDSGSGIYLNPAMLSLRHPVEFAQRRLFMNAGCVRATPGQVDRSYVERLHNPLLFDFVLKRNLRATSKRLAAGIFETRTFFDRRPVASA